jgi:uncharacterized membrane protein YedE/YeeE
MVLVSLVRIVAPELRGARCCHDGGRFRAAQVTGADIRRRRVRGLVFGVVLIVSGMANPAKVLGLLDIAGAWDPSLALVMAAVVATGAWSFHAASRRKHSLLGDRVRLPEMRRIDARLVGGSLLFGVGWGIAGLCPGPALVTLGIGGAEIAMFVAAMLAGILAFERVERRAALNA